METAIPDPVCLTLADTDQLNDCLTALSAAGWHLAREADLIRVAPSPISPARAVLRLGAEGMTPDPYALLQAMGATALDQQLVDSVAAGLRVDRVIIGFNWTLVQAGDLCGIARSPGRDTEGARSIRPEDGFHGYELHQLARYLLSMDPLARSLGLAAVNAFWNRPQPLPQVAALEVPGGGLASIDAPGAGTVIIGGFRGAQKRLTEARIVEREPKPGDIPVAEAPQAYGRAKRLCITAQTLMNGSLPAILGASDMVPERKLLGPSAPVCPIVLQHGLDEVFGGYIHDPEAAARFILESGTMIMRDEIARNRCLRA